MYEDELVLEGEVGKLASKQLEDKQESVTLFVSLSKIAPRYPIYTHATIGG